MIIGILQPGYLPWFGFFEQLNKSDVFIIYDDVQYSKNSWRNRNKIKTSNGLQWLTVPVNVNFRNKLSIKDVKIDNKQKWRENHLISIRQNYSKAPFFNKYISIFEDAYSREWDYLVDLDMHFILELSNCLGIETKKIIKSSTLSVEGDKIGKIINLCKIFAADTFYEGAAGMNYIDKNIFLKHGIEVIFQDYKHPEYKQLHGEYVPYLSIIDLLFNCGDDSLAILLKKGSEAKN